jgi:adenylate cyclase
MKFFRPRSQTQLSRVENDARSTSRLRLPDWLAFLDWSKWRLEITAVTLALLIALALVPHVLSFAQRDEYERSIPALAWGWQPLEAIEHRLYDARFAARGPVAPRSRDRIAIVAIDQVSLRNLAEWPWPRRFHARLIRRLQQAGASAIVWDVSFDVKQRPQPDGTLSVDDQALVAASEAAGNVIISAGFQPASKGVSPQERAALNSTTVPFDELDSTTPDVGFNYLPPNSSGQMRRYAWRANVSGAEVASMAALAVALDSKQLDGNENARFFQLLNSNRWPDAQGRMHNVPVTEMKIGQEDRVWTTPIFFWGPAGTFPTYSYADVLTGQRGEWSDAALKQKFGGRIVFIGGTAPILKDLFAAPHFTAAEIGEAATAAQISGVELHASMAAQMLDGRYIALPSTQSTLAWLFGLCIGSALWLASLRRWVSKAARLAQLQWRKWQAPGRIHGLVWFALFAGLAWLPAWLFWQWTHWQFARHDNWIVMVYPLLGTIACSGSTLLLFFVDEAGERSKIMSRFKRLVSPDVLDHLLAYPEEVDLRPHNSEITVLFGDLEGFTSYSDANDPADVVDALNAFMTRMVAMVKGHGGTVDKFIGDNIMAFFGAPIPRWDHAAQALACAVAMQNECARFREETGIEFYMRIGVHSGEATIGLMGSEERADYTVIGDTVNLASRLENKNKELGSRIMCSDDTYVASEGAVIAKLEQVRVAGLSGLLNVWVVRGMSGMAPNDEHWYPLPSASDDKALQDGTAAPSLLDENAFETSNAQPLPALPEARFRTEVADYDQEL